MKHVKIAAAVVIVSSLTLGVSACSKNKETTEAASTTTATSSSAASSSSAVPSSSVAPAPSSSAAPKPTSSASPAPAAEEEAPVEELPEDLPPIPTTVASLAPVADGEPASEEDAAAIRELLNTVNYAPTVRQYFVNLMDNTCSRVLNENGVNSIDPNTAPDTPMEDLPEFAAMKPTINDVTDIMVKGDEASATVTASGGGQQSTNTMRFLWEDGRWKMCN